jgi:hypothetical protein
MTFYSKGTLRPHQIRSGLPYQRANQGNHVFWNSKSISSSEGRIQGHERGSTIDSFCDNWLDPIWTRSLCQIQFGPAVQQQFSHSTLVATNRDCKRRITIFIHQINGDASRYEGLSNKLSIKHGAMTTHTVIDAKAPFSQALCKLYFLTTALASSKTCGGVISSFKKSNDST